MTSSRGRTLASRWLLLLLCFAAIPALAQHADKLSQVKKIYVDVFGADKSAADARTQLVRLLGKSHEVQLVQTPAEADAVIKGASQIWTTGHISPSPRSHDISQPTYAGYLSIEVVGQSGQTLWSYLATPSKFALGTLSADLSSQIVTRLLRDLKSTVHAEPSTTSGAAAGPSASVTGAGSTFSAPLYQKWFQSYTDLHPEVSLHYQAVGSAQGLERLQSGATDFGASDMPLTDQAIADARQRFVQIPIALGAVVPIYNVQHSGEIRLTPEVLAGIYLGKIKKWNDPALRATNSRADLPNSDIVVVHRSDGSGTTFVWSDYLSKVSPEWKSSVGEGLTVTWPVGTGAAYNDGVASAVQQTQNSIGYVEFIYAIQHELSFAAVRNAQGHYIKASLDSVMAAVQGSLGAGSDLRVSLTNPPGSASYPIASYTWLLLPSKIADETQRTALLALVRWMLTSGQKSCSALGYAPLPADVTKRALDSLDAIK